MSENTEARPAEETPGYIQPPAPLFEVDPFDELEEIANRRHVTQQGQDKTKPAKASGEEDGQQKIPPIEETHRRMITDDLGDTFIKTKVYGKEQEVSLEELQRNWQQNQAADQKLNHAKQLEAQYLAELEALKAERANPAPETPPKAPSDQESKKEALRQLLDSWNYDGEIPDESVELLFQPPGQPTTQAPDPAQFAEFVERQLEAKQVIKAYQKDYPEISKDPYLDQITANYAMELSQEGYDLESSMRQAAQKTKEWLQEKSSIAVDKIEPAQTSAAIQRRQQAQESLRNLPNATPTPRQSINTPKPQSIEDNRRSAIAEMMEQQV